MNTYVYVAWKPGFFKIGYSANPRRRIAEMQTYQEYPLTLIHTYPGGRLEERKLHQLLEPFHSNREWYHDVDEAFDILVDAAGDDNKRLIRYTLRDLIRTKVGIYRWAMRSRDIRECEACGIQDMVKNMNLVLDSPAANIWDENWGAQVHGYESYVAYVAYCHNCYEQMEAA